MRRLLILAVLVLTLTACASNPPRVERSEFEDIPVPKGLSADVGKSTIIESPTVKAARIVYKGRIEPDSLAIAYRTTLEANGWRHLNTASADQGITQVYDKQDSSLQVMIYGSWWYTWVEVSTTRIVNSSAAQAR